MDTDDLYAVGNDILTAGDGPTDQPAVGEVRPIYQAATGLVLAYYRITEVSPPRQLGWLPMIRGVICERPGGAGES